MSGTRDQRSLMMTIHRCPRGGERRRKALRRSLALAASIGGVLLLACAPRGAARGELGLSERSPGNLAPPGWVTQRDPSGFVVSYPKGWSVAVEQRAGQQSGRVDISAGSSKASILPFFTAQPLTDAQAAVVFRGLVQTVAAEITWSSPEQVAGAHAAALRATGASSTQDRRAVSLLTGGGVWWGTAGQLYVGSARPEDYERVGDTLAQIFQSFHVQGQPVAAPPKAPAFEYVRWRDPNEGAFSVEIPQGWKAQGGTVRPVADLVQGKVDVVSPDGAVSLYLGDSPYPIYREPDPLTSTVYPAGSRIPLPDGYRAPVEPYMPAPKYLIAVILPGRNLSQLQTTAPPRERSDVASRLPTYGGHARYSAADVDYTFVRGGQPYRGHALCIIEEVLGTPALWHVWQLDLFEAPAARSAEGAAAYAHLIQTYTIDAQWAQRQSQTAMKQAEIWSSSGQQINQLMLQGYRQRQATMDQIADRRDKAILGQVDVTDPTTKTVYRVEDSANYYWIDNQGKIVGTDTSATPNLDFRPLVVNPKQ
jgi:hypothetical protein